jgi:fido (protein-threonine AMPylation protein)
VKRFAVRSTKSSAQLDHFLRELHRRLYGDIWAWARAFRRRELNIGVA